MTQDINGQTRDKLQVDRDQAKSQLAALGYQDGDTVFLRQIAPKFKGKKSEAINSICQLSSLPRQQNPEMGLYIVVNGGGHKDENVQQVRAIFCEFDDRPIEEQVSFWQERGLPEPSLQIKTRKSIHSYWVLTEGCPIEEGKQLQDDLLELVGGDRTLKNLSRCMRLAGSHHIKDGAEPIQCNIINKTGNRYSYKALRQIIPQHKTVKCKAPPKVETQQTYPNQCDQSLSLGEFLRSEIYPRLSPEQIYNWSGHDWQHDRSGNKLRGCCPMHNSESGTAFYANQKDGVWLWRCPACNVGGDPVQYRWMLKGGSGTPRGKDFVEIVSELAHEAGVAMPQYQSNGGALPNSGNTGIDGEQLYPANQWDAPSSHNYEVGRWIRLKDVEYQHEADIPDTFRSRTYKSIQATIMVRETNPDGSKGLEKAVKGFKIQEFKPLADFDFHVERILESSEGGGLALRISRLRAGQLSTKRIIVNSIDCTSVKDFQDAVKRGLGTGVSCKLRFDDLQDLLHDRVEQYHLKGGRIYQLIDRVGQQVDGTWVFENCQFTKQGNLTTEDASGWVWNPRLGIDDYMPSPKIVEQDALALKRLVDVQRRFFGSNFKPALITLGAVAAGVHYQEIVEKEGSFPIVNLYGDSGSNKTIAAENALAVMGWSKGGMLSDVSQSGLYERLKLSGSLSNCLDDPVRTPELEELLKSLYNAKPRVVRGNSQEPHGAIMVTSNHACGDHSPATLSRLIQLWFPVVTDGNKSAWQDLQLVQKQASGALSSLIKLGYPAREIRALEDELIQHLPYAHARIARSLALVTYYTIKVAELAGATEDIKQYVLDQLCPSANDADSTADSLTDFLDKLHSLQADALVGEWNTRKIKDEQGNIKSVAIHLSNVWRLIDKQFSPIYSQRVIKSLVEKAGGKTRSVQKFHKNKDESLTYYRALLTPRTDQDGIQIVPDEPEMLSRRCIEIPAHLAAEFISNYEASYHSVTTSYHQLPKNGNQRNSYPEGVKKQSPNPVTTVTNNLEEERKEKREKSAQVKTGEASLKNELVTEKVVTDGNGPENSSETLPEYGLPFFESNGNSVVTGGNRGNWILSIGDRVTVIAAGKYQRYCGEVLEYDPLDATYRIGLDKGGEGWWKLEGLVEEDDWISIA